MKTTLHNLHDVDLDSSNVQYIGRRIVGHDGYFGNPFRLMSYERKGATIEKYRQYFYDAMEIDPEFKERVHALKGKKLACWCKRKPCHGEVIIEYLNNL